MPRSHRLRSALVLPFVAVLLATGCTTAEESVRDEEGTITETNDKASVFDMQVGDCYNDPGSEASELETLPAVPCDQEHDYEVYESIELEGDDFPGAEAIEAEADEKCQAAFDTFVGTAYDDSTLDFIHLTPTQQTWQADDRAVTCLIGDTEGRVTGTLKGAER